MPTTLALSAYPGDAVFSVGALLHALPGDRRHVTCFGRDVAEAGAVQQLGLRHTDLGLALAASAKTVTDALAPQLEEDAPANVLLPLGLAARAGEVLFIEVLPALKRLAPGARFVHYYPLPYVSRRKSRYPELAFARAIRGLAEADADAAAFQWKPRGMSAAAALETKRAAALTLRDELTNRLFPEPEPRAPSDDAELEALLVRALGTREWVQLA